MGNTKGTIKMKQFRTYAVALLASFLLTGCEAPSGESTDSDTNTNPLFSPTAPADLTTIIGMWNPAGGGNQWCEQDVTTLQWSCATNYSTPAACTPVWPIINSYSVLGMGIYFDGTTFALPTPQTPSYDNTTGIVTLSPSGLQWGIFEHNGMAILSYGAGCNLLFEKQ